VNYQSKLTLEEDIMSNFIYIPSFFSGEYGGTMKKNFRFSKSNMTCRYYADDFPEKYQHKYALISAGANSSKTYRHDLGLDNSFVLGDSGGYQIASGAMKWDIKHRDRIFNWLETNSDVAINLDIPPRMKYAGKFNECLDISKDNFKYFYENQTGNTKFLNVLQGENELSYLNWYNGVKDFQFNGWSIGGVRGNLYRMLSGIYTLINNKEHLNLNNDYFHILGASRVRDFLMLIQLQKSLEDIGSNITVTTDSSTPDRHVVYGLYFINYSIKHENLDAITFPNGSNNPDIIDWFKTTNQTIPKFTEFDNIIGEEFSWKDVADWNLDCKIGMRLHNFYLLKDAIQAITWLVYGHDYILKQSINSNTYKILQSIDEMVKSSNPTKIFEKYKPLYMKLSNMSIKTDVKNHDFF
jgi:hypothetical protein